MLPPSKSQQESLHLLSPSMNSKRIMTRGRKSIGMRIAVVVAAVTVAAAAAATGMDSLDFVGSGTFLPLLPLAEAVTIAPRHCRGGVKHLHLAVGHDPSTQMTISFASKWSHPDVDMPLGGVHYGLSPTDLKYFQVETDIPDSYASTFSHQRHHYYSPYQHHITLEGLKPSTTYYYVAVLGNRTLGADDLQQKPLKNHPTQHEEYYRTTVGNKDDEEVQLSSFHEGVHENLIAENRIQHGQEMMNGENEEGYRSLRRQNKNNQQRRQLGPPPYDGHEQPCLEGFQVRSFTTAPAPGSAEAESATFAIIGDLGQFSHSQETVEHMSSHREGIDAVVLVGDIAYTEYDHRRWDTFFDFLDDFSMFDEVPLQVATGNHDIDKQENDGEIFVSYETRFRMPEVYPAELGRFEGPPGLLNLDAPPYPLPYDWGNAYYVFDYGPAKHIVLSAYSDMNPGSKQYVWFLSELQKIDRTVTPWLLVTMHVPIYNTFDKHHHDLQIVAAKEYLEPLFVEYHVNVVFTGHIHAYQRTHNMALDVVEETGPLHITIGAGGRNCDAPFMYVEAEPFIVTRDASFYGYGRFEIFNKTHAEWRWIPLSLSEKHDYNQVKGKDVHLPPLDHDTHMIENQFYLAQQ